MLISEVRFGNRPLVSRLSYGSLAAELYETVQPLAPVGLPDSSPTRMSSPAPPTMRSVLSPPIRTSFPPAPTSTSSPELPDNQSPFCPLADPLSPLAMAS